MDATHGSGSPPHKEKSRSASFSKLPVIFSRRNSAKSLQGSREEDSPSPRSSSPHSPPSGFFTPRKSHLQEGLPLFSLYAQQTIEREGHLHVNAGDCVTFLYIKSPPKDAWVVMDGENKGLLLKSDIIVDQLHAGNIYLGTMDALVQDPSWLKALLQSNDPDFEKIENRLVPLLGARHLLHPVLKAYCTLEQMESTNNIPYRDSTLASKIILALFGADTHVIEFKKKLIDFLYSTLSPDLGAQCVRKKRIVELEELPAVLKACIYYCHNQLCKNAIPASVIMALNSIKTVSEQCPPFSIKTEVMLGAVFILRFICPALSEESDDIKKLAKMLNMVACRVEPEKEHEFYRVSQAMAELYEPMEKLLVGIASVEMQWVPEQSVVDEAAAFYYWLAKKFPDHPAIQLLKAKLGDEKNKPEIDARIQKISQFIQDACLVHGNAMTSGKSL